MSQVQSELVKFCNSANEAVQWYGKALTAIQKQKANRAYVELPVAFRIINQYAGEKVQQIVCLQNEIVFRNVAGNKLCSTDIKQAVITATMMPTFLSVARLGVDLSGVNCDIGRGETYVAYIERIFSIIDRQIKLATSPE